MTIQELATSAEVTTRTIRYYVEQGVLPPPDRGRPAEYTEEHRRILDLIRRLKAQYLPLEEIRDIVRRLNPGEVEQFLRDTEAAAPPAEALSPATDYITSVLGRSALRQQLKEQAPQLASPAVYAHAPAPPPAPVAARRAAPAQVAAAIAATGDAAAGDIAAGAVEGPAAGEETWQRIVLAPGVELQYQAGAAAGQKSAIARLVAAAKKIMAGESAGMEELE